MKRPKIYFIEEKFFIEIIIVLNEEIIIYKFLDYNIFIIMNILVLY